MKEPYIHDTSIVQSNDIGNNTNVWQFCVVLPRAKIGENCNICSHCFIENEVILGDNVTVKNGVYLYDGITIEDNVFIGPNVTFTNDKYPRSKKWPDNYPKTIIRSGASIGGGAVILPGITIGRNSIVGAGAIITKNIPDDTIVYNAQNRIERPAKA